MLQPRVTGCVVSCASPCQLEAKLSRASCHASHAASRTFSGPWRSRQQRLSYAQQIHCSASYRSVYAAVAPRPVTRHGKGRHCAAAYPSTFGRHSTGGVRCGRDRPSRSFTFRTCATASPAGRGDGGDDEAFSIDDLARRLSAEAGRLRVEVCF